MEVFIEFVLSVSKSYSLTVDFLEDEWYFTQNRNITPSLDHVIVTTFILITD